HREVATSIRSGSRSTEGEAAKAGARAGRLELVGVGSGVADGRETFSDWPCPRVRRLVDDDREWAAETEVASPAADCSESHPNSATNNPAVQPRIATRRRTRLRCNGPISHSTRPRCRMNGL